MFLAALEAARPRQWVKNLFVVAPLVFAKQLTDRVALGRAAIAVAIFCALSSAVYLWNDVIDIEKDRAHPRKQTRPIAAGRLLVLQAQLLSGLLALTGLLGALLLRPELAVCALTYLISNVAYSLYLKRVVYLDVLLIAFGFLLRVVGGAMAISVEASPYLLLCTGLLACYLGFGKRAHELAVAGEQAALQRPVLSSYRLPTLRVLLAVTAMATLISYILYTRAPHTVRFFHSSRMIWTAPFAALGLARFSMLISGHPTSDSPTEEMLGDRLFIANLVAWAAVTTAIIYFH